MTIAPTHMTDRATASWLAAKAPASLGSLVVTPTGAAHVAASSIVFALTDRPAFAIVAVGPAFLHVEFATNRDDADQAAREVLPHPSCTQVAVLPVTDR